MLLSRHGFCPPLLVAIVVLIGCGGHTRAPPFAATENGGSAGLQTGGQGGNTSASGGTGVANGGATGFATLKDYLGNTEYPDDFWQSATFTDSHLDAAPFEQAVAKIRSSGWEVHSFLVARNGRLVFERYGWNSGSNPDDPNKTPHQVVPSERHPIWSVTKSMTSALVGIAISEGFISGADHKVSDWFAADYAQLNPSAEKSLITLEHLLTMRSGLQFTEGESAIFDTPDPARAMLARDLTSAPGATWNYSTGSVEIVAEILRMTTGLTPLEYAKSKLFGPIGIANPPWDASQSGTNHGGFGLSLTAREMARFGELYRNYGVWAQKQVVPTQWTTDSTSTKCATTWGMDYGYLWFVPNLADFFVAIGMYGQQIFVSRSKGLVIVFTGNIPSSTANIDYSSLITDYVLPAVR